MILAAGAAKTRDFGRWRGGKHVNDLRRWRGENTCKIFRRWRCENTWILRRADTRRSKGGLFAPFHRSHPPLPFLQNPQGIPVLLIGKGFPRAARVKNLCLREKLLFARCTHEMISFRYSFFRALHAPPEIGL